MLAHDRKHVPNGHTCAQWPNDTSTDNKNSTGAGEVCFALGVVFATTEKNMRGRETRGLWPAEVKREKKSLPLVLAGMNIGQTVVHA